nr:amino acid permease [Marinithermofilum abyssi]
MLMNLFRKKSISELIRTSQRGQTLKRELGVLDLVLLGIGATIGTGIFVLTGTGALKAGPSLMISFVIAGLTVALTALSYAEFASTVPVSGSAYTYSYATLGELIAWMIGWNLILEYLLAVSLVSAGWSGYLQSLIAGMGIHLPDVITAAPGSTSGQTTLFNLPAFLIVLLITFLLSRGIKESKRVNNLMVLLKVGIILLFIVIGIWYVKPSNWTPFVPFGSSGIFAAAAMVFSAFLGFDAITTASEEARNPRRDVPRGILFSLLICTLLYMIVAAVMTGIVPYREFAGNEDHPVSLALQIAGQNWFAGFVDLGALLGMTTVMLVLLYGLTRITFSMSRDGMLPQWFASVHPKYRTPFGTTWMFGLVAGVTGGVVPLTQIAELVNMGTLSAFITISLGIIVLRVKQPDLPRAFRCPGVPVVPLLAILFCGFLIMQLSSVTWFAFAIWLLAGLTIYFAYSHKHSALRGEK